MDRTSFLNLMAAAQLAYGNKLSKETSDIYWQHLQDADAATAEQLLAEHIKAERFFPRISDLRPMVRPQHGQRMIPPPGRPKSEYGKQADKILLALIMRVGGVRPDTIKALRAARDAMVADAERDEPGHTEFAAELDTLLRGLHHGHEPTENRDEKQAASTV